MILFINTASEHIHVALLQNKTPVFQKSWISKHDEAERLIPEIQKLLKKAKIDFQDLKGVAVVPGPGPFTRTRIGVTAANVLSFALKIPLYEVTKTGKWRRMKQIRPYYSMPPNITPSKQWSLGSLKSSVV